MKRILAEVLLLSCLFFTGCRPKATPASVVVESEIPDFSCVCQGV